MFLVQSILGMTGPNGLYPCPVSIETVHDLTGDFTKTFSSRTVSRIQQQFSSFQANGSMKSRASLFESFENTCLLNRKQLIIDRISCMPLHVSLGLGQALLNKIKNLAIGIDNEIKTLNGIPTDEV